MARGWLSQAVENVVRFSVVGVTEKMEAVVTLLAMELVCNPANWAYRDEQRTINPPSFKIVPERIQKRITSLVCIDQEIYERANYMFAEKVASTRMFSHGWRMLQDARRKLTPVVNLLKIDIHKLHVYQILNNLQLTLIQRSRVTMLI